MTPPPLTKFIEMVKIWIIKYILPTFPVSPILFFYFREDITPFVPPPFCIRLCQQKALKQRNSVVYTPPEPLLFAAPASGFKVFKKKDFTLSRKVCSHENWDVKNFNFVTYILWHNQYSTYHSSPFLAALSCYESWYFNRIERSRKNPNPCQNNLPKKKRLTACCQQVKLK